MTAIDDVARPFRLDWGWMLMRGILAIALGVFGFSHPALTIVVLTAAWGAYTFIDGVLALVFARRATHLELPGWPAILIGILGIGAGLLTFLEPKATAMALVLIAGAWALSVGASEVATAMKLHKQIANEWFLGIAGAVTILFGVLMLARPGAGAAAMGYLVSGFAVVTGALLVLCAMRLRKFEARFEA